MSAWPVCWTEPEYLLLLGGWTVTLLLCGVGLLKARRRYRLKHLDARPTHARSTPLSTRLNARQHRRGWLLIHLGLSAWSLLWCLTVLEWFFVLCVDHSDAFNGTNVSKRWFRHYIDAQRNDDGFRDRRTLRQPAPPGTKRIVILGDSYVAGHGLRRMEDRFTEKLEHLLQQQGCRVWVHNLGEPGYEVTLIEGLAQAVLQEQPIDMLLYAYMLNDIEGYDPRTEEYLRQLLQRQPTHPLITRTYFLNWLYFRWQQLREHAAINYFPHLRDSYDTAAWQGVQHSLQKIHQACRQHQVAFRLVLFPFMQGLGPDSPFLSIHQKLQLWAEEEGIPCLDMEPLLSAHRHEPIYVNRFDSHPNEYAHTLIAQRLYSWLKDDPVLCAHHRD
ncbi:MAG: hypothetical protein KatS3mg114_1138 [Planctomycetaceae bacterium]|nr:MAG: hypothetical protein KatS3mg114_1138 [Planctomycetaceae bacterium]